MRRPRVSVLTTTYNHERFIGPCIESVLAQTFPDWEMIIVDDGSTDRTGEVARGYDDPRIAYHRLPHRGIPALTDMYRFALGRARGAFVAILAGDDAWPAWRLEKQVPALEEEGVVMCFGRGVLIDQHGRTIGENRIPRLPRVVNRPVGTVLHRLLLSNFIPSYAALLSRAALDHIGGYVAPPGVTGVDSPTCMRLALEGEFRFLDEPLGYWRVHPGQHTGTHRLEQARTDMAYSLEFFRALSPEMKARSGWTEERLARALQRSADNAYFEVGRRMLLTGQRREAYAHLLTALRKGSLGTKAKAAAGLAFGVAGLDFERLPRLIGRTPLR